ncbi:MAG: hypothetical protein K2N78_09000 [Oscillospiraceae bacterium]|nr:hypothetical protein [Oscillospiraceae bacterium]
MNKDDILARSRAENQGTDEYETRVLEKAGKLSVQVGMVACCIIAVSSVMVTGRVNYGCWIIYFSILATLFWTKYHYLRKRHELMLSVIATGTGLLFTVLFVLELAGWLHG